ncbi:MAG: hypothetical protein WC319_09925 [Candidatus Paceibacterota bacterium]|jgi:sRNA-binding regulator protein Hfq
MTKTKQAYLRDAKEIENLEEGKEVVLLFANGEEYTGIFKGLDDEEIILKALESESMIGLPLNMLNGYLERFK